MNYKKNIVDDDPVRVRVCRISSRSSIIFSIHQSIYSNPISHFHVKRLQKAIFKKIAPESVYFHPCIRILISDGLNNSKNINLTRTGVYRFGIRPVALEVLFYILLNL